MPIQALRHVYPKLGLWSICTLCRASTVSRGIVISVRYLSKAPSLRSRKDSKDFVSGIWYIPSPSTTDPTTIIPKLPQLPLPLRSKLRRALILATPGVAHWFSPTSTATFHQDAMNWMYSPLVANRPPSSYVAIVDSLPAPEYFTEWKVFGDRPYAPAEGIAIQLMMDVISRPWTPEHGDAPATLSVQSLRSSEERRERGSVLPHDVFSQLTMPLANTLFVNGRRSTAFRTAWHVDEEQKKLIRKRDPVDLAGVQFRLYKAPHKVFDFEVPLVPLTLRRKVVSSMGNVVREIEGDGGEVMRASAELEAVVPKFLKQCQGSDKEAPEIQVFARIMPQDGRSGEISMPGRGSLKSATTSEQGNEDFKMIALKLPHEALWHGGQMYRVMSGGGGWGKKAGLLSLNPVTNFEPSKSSDTGMFPDPDDPDIKPDGTPDLGALVPAGYTIQFFAAKVLQPYPPYFIADPEQKIGDYSTALYTPEKWMDIDNKKLVFGHSPMDGLLQADTHKAEARAASVTVLPGCFGALTEGGSSLLASQRSNVAESPRQFRYSKLNEFRVDTPFALYKTLVRRVSDESVEDESDVSKAAAQLKSSAKFKIRKIPHSQRPDPARIVRRIYNNVPANIPEIGQVNLDKKIRVVRTDEPRARREPSTKD